MPSSVKTMYSTNTGTAHHMVRSLPIISETAVTMDDNERIISIMRSRTEVEGSIDSNRSIVPDVVRKGEWKEERPLFARFPGNTSFLTKVCYPRASSAMLIDIF